MRQDYEERVRQQIQQYADTVDMHDLPPIFHVWSHNFLRPALENVFGPSSVNDFYVSAMLEAAPKISGRRPRMLSVGCGDGSIETAIADTLLQKGLTDFEIICADLSPLLLQKLERDLDPKLRKHLVAVETDLNKIAIEGHFAAIMAHHSLHHIENLEGLFDYVANRLEPEGIFATSDMIGRNGHMRWAETAVVLQAIWPMLEPVNRYHVALKKMDERFFDHDCSTEGFEGIRAQDVLPEILKRFKPAKFVGTGGFIDVLVDRGYGPSFNAENEADLKFIRFISELNEVLIDAGVVKPTLMFAHFVKTEVEERFYRGRSAAFCMRDPTAVPSWTRFYEPPRMSEEIPCLAT